MRRPHSAASDVRAHENGEALPVHCIAYGNNKSDESDRTVSEWIELGAAPEYKALKARLAKPAGGA